MGTRHLHCAVIDGEYKVAQYGQWDGYPSGQGTDLLEILRGVNLDYLKKTIKNCQYLTEDEIKVIDDDLDWKVTYPYLSRDTGAQIYRFINDNNGLKLVNKLKFAADSLFCEWAYVIDFDKNTLEVYRGFNEIALTEADRFFFLNEFREKNYHPVKLVATFDLTNLPNDDTFLASFKDPEDE